MGTLVGIPCQTFLSDSRSRQGPMHVDFGRRRAFHRRMASFHASARRSAAWSAVLARHFSLGRRTFSDEVFQSPTLRQRPTLYPATYTNFSTAVGKWTHKRGQLNLAMWSRYSSWLHGQWRRPRMTNVVPKIAIYTSATSLERPVS